MHVLFQFSDIKWGNQNPPAEKNRQQNDQKKKHKRTNNDLLNTAKKTKIKQHKFH